MRRWVAHDNRCFTNLRVCQKEQVQRRVDLEQHPQRPHGQDHDGDDEGKLEQLDETVEDGDGCGIAINLYRRNGAKIRQK